MIMKCLPNSQGSLVSCSKQFLTVASNILWLLLIILKVHVLLIYQKVCKAVYRSNKKFPQQKNSYSFSSFSLIATRGWLSKYCSCHHVACKQLLQLATGITQERTLRSLSRMTPTVSEKCCLHNVLWWLQYLLCHSPVLCYCCHNSKFVMGLTHIRAQSKSRVGPVQVPWTSPSSWKFHKAVSCGHTCK